MAEKNFDPLDDPAPRRRGRLRNPLRGDAFGRGAEGFARVEEACVCGLEALGAVIATGGSVATEDAAMEHLKEGGLEEMEIRGSLTLNGEEIGRTQDVICMPGQSVCILK